MVKKRVAHHRKLSEPKLPVNRMPAWLLFLAYLAYLRATQPQYSPELAALRTLIVAATLILIVMALVVGGDPSAIPTVLQHWHWLP